MVTLVHAASSSTVLKVLDLGLSFGCPSAPFEACALFFLGLSFQKPGTTLRSMPLQGSQWPLLLTVVESLTNVEDSCQHAEDFDSDTRFFHPNSLVERNCTLLQLQETSFSSIDIFQ
jgi:hypothetical protein